MTNEESTLDAVDFPPPGKARPLRAILCAAGITILHLAFCIVILAPARPLAFRYRTLMQHDSFWFGNIVERGYGTILPPIARKMMEVSNVAFFPAYPMLADAVHRWAGLGIENALLVTSQVAAAGFWTYFFLLCDRWRISPTARFFGALVILAHPAAFFTVAAYSESLFLMALVGFIYWSSAEGRLAPWLAALHGIAMSATRIVGIPCAAYPVVRAIFRGGWRQLRDWRGWLRAFARPVGLMIVATFGALGFFAYCFVRWGHWDLYLQTQAAGWAIAPDYLAIFRPESYRWALPDLQNPTTASQFTMSLGAVAFLALVILEVIPAFRRRTLWQVRIGLYFCAFVSFYLAVSGVASVAMESMLRYQFCVHALIVLALLHFFAQLPAPSKPVRILGLTVVALLSVAGIALQGWYVWNFTRGGWIA